LTLVREDKPEHIWLKALSEKLQKQDVEELIGRIQRLSGKQEREYADSVLQVSISANFSLHFELPFFLIFYQMLYCVYISAH
jgi:hypothetical protein